MIRDEYLQRLRDAAHLELYLSGVDGARLSWPWRMEPAHQASHSYRAVCDRYVIDSAPQRDDVTTRDVLDAAVTYGADVASLADVYQDKDATVDSLLAGLETADDHPFAGTLLLPLQAPVVDCWREIGEPTDAWLGIGGLKDAPNAARFDAAMALRDAVGPGPWLHGFGWGVSPGFGSRVREQPAVLDSVDYSTPVRDIPTDATPGEEVMSVQAAYAGARLIRDLRECSPYAAGDDTTGTQGRLGEF